MRMRLLSLGRSTDRLALFRARNPHCAGVERVNAVDGRLADRQRLIENAVLAPELGYSDGALGCALSHLTQWRDCIENELPITIVEDDAVLCANFEAEAARVIAGLPDDWEYVMWGYNFDAPLVCDLGTDLARCGMSFDQDALRRTISGFAAQSVDTRGFRLVSGFGTVCYSISPRGATRLLNFCMPLRPMEQFYPALGRRLQNTGIDNMLAQVWPDMKAYVAVPPLAVTENDPGASTVQTARPAQAGAPDPLTAAALESIFERIGITDGVAIGVREDGDAPLCTATLRQIGWDGFDIAVQPAMLTRALRDRAVSAEFDLLYAGASGSGFHVLHQLLGAFRPRAIVVAYDPALGEHDLVAPSLRTAEGSQGASRAALIRLAVAKGYAAHPSPGSTRHALLLRQDVACLSGEAWPETAWPALPAIATEPTGIYLTSEHYLLDGVAVASTPHGRIAYFENDRYIGRAYADGGFWDEATVTRIAALLHGKSGLVLDVGAHIGSHAILLARLNQALNVCCFEPQRPLFLLLERNIVENGLERRIEAVWSAVGHRSGAFAMSSTLDEDGLSQDLDYGGAARVNFGGVQLGRGGVACPLTRIDDLTLPPVCYVKLDVEGAETLALDGMGQTLAATMPIVFFEDRADRRLADETLDALDVPAALRTQTPSAQLTALGYVVEPFGIDHIARPPQPARRASEGISRRIFQTWKSRTDLPGNFAVWSRSFRNLNPDYEHVLEDDAGNRAFVAAHFPWFLSVYDAYPQEIMRADAVRYFQLFLHGGFYADMDAECLRPLDHLLQAGDVVLARMGPDPAHPHSIPNAMMASRPRQEFWLLVFWLLTLAARQDGSVEARTGPVMLKAAVDLWNAGDALVLPLALAEARSWLSPELQQTVPTKRLTILPPRRWYALDWTDPAHQLLRMQILGGTMLDPAMKTALFADADMVTYWSHSW